MKQQATLHSAAKHVLLVDDEEGVRASLEQILNEAGYLVTSAASGEEALDCAEEQQYDLLLTDLKMPEMDGLQLLQKLQDKRFDATTIVMSAYGNQDIALEAMRLGAYDYISKPFNAEEIILTLKKAEEREKLRKENALLKDQVRKRYSFSNIIADSPSMAGIFETIKKIADYKTTILIVGESGTGKELIARAIHQNSTRRSKKFVAINCGAIPENLLESELFGHRKGAFTDATRDKKGLFEEADGGTILLDEIGELPLHLQVKLLRVLQEGQIRPVGGSDVISIDVRVIAATLRDLEQDVIDGRFRDDLYYRLNVVSIQVPPLRDRKEDIPILVHHFLQKHQAKLQLPVDRIDDSALKLLMNYSWKGNVRELENAIERAMILTEGDSITASSLPKS
ncbi:MAG: sigma-54-dependent Fis family transcriptional regulator, partial [Bdellovibrionales bacterium]|nr:sigma-54-dependent Fis family transcriptional regulator [Bdellovibrionales bacterium]